MSRRRRYLRALGPALLLAVGGAYAVGSWNWCGDWQLTPPTLETAAKAVGPLRAGAGRSEIQPPYPAIPAGYAPPRPDLTSAERPLHARAVVLEVPPVRIGIVSLDALSASEEVVNEVRRSAGALGLTDVWINATHSHSSLGGYDDRLIAELAGIGRFREEARDALVQAATTALREAVAALAPAGLRVGTQEAPSLVRARSGDAADARLTRLVFTPAPSENGSASDRPIAELWIWSAHPTLVARPIPALSPDYPGWLSSEPGVDDVPVVLLQGAVGNASAAVPEGEGSAPERYARALSDAARTVPLEAIGATTWLGISRVRTRLPRPDASRLVPGVVRAAGDNLLCSSADREAEVSALKLGPVTLLAIPGEPSLAAARALEEKSGATRVLSVANGYVGYLEPEAVVREGGGESKRQYYAPALLDALAEAAMLAVETTRQ